MRAAQPQSDENRTGVTCDYTQAAWGQQGFRHEDRGGQSARKPMASPPRVKSTYLDAPRIPGSELGWAGGVLTSPRAARSWFAQTRLPREAALASHSQLHAEAALVRTHTGLAPPPRSSAVAAHGAAPRVECKPRQIVSVFCNSAVMVTFLPTCTIRLGGHAHAREGHDSIC